MLQKALFKNLRNKIVTALGIGIVVSLGIFGVLYWKQSQPLYNMKFTSLVNVGREGDNLSVGFCQNVQSSVIIYKDRAVLDLGPDKMTGKLVGITPQNGLIVSLTNNLTVVLYKGHLDETDSDVLVIESLNNSIVLSETENCEGIAPLLEKIQK